MIQLKNGWFQFVNEFILVIHKYHPSSSGRRLGGHIYCGIPPTRLGDLVVLKQHGIP